MNASITKADVVIIGTGMAGTTLVREMRKQGDSVTIHMITSDDGAVYSKPMLSNALAQGKTPDGLVQKTAAQFGEQQNVTMWTHTRVIAINRRDKTVIVKGPEGRDVIGYENLVLATGAHPRPYTAQGAGEETFKTVNSLTDYARWRTDLSAGARVLIVGAGLIGLEFANDLVAQGFHVDVVDPVKIPLGRLLPEALGPVVENALADAGVNFHLGHVIADVVEGPEGNVAHLDDGTPVPFDIALSAIGLIPNVKLAEEIGLKVAQGIVVDRTLRTADANIFALGDCAQTDAGVLPFVLPLMAEARALAQTLTGTDTAIDFPAMPVAVKTPAIPIVVCPPAPGTEGEWVVEGQGTDWRAVFVTPGGEILGFALTGAETQGRQALAREVPHVLAA